MPDKTKPLIKIRLLGSFGVSVGEQPVDSLENLRLQSLLAFLVLHAGESLKRSRIAYTFWPDSEEKQALTNFRNLLHKLRHALPAIDHCLSVDSQAVCWKRDAPYELDARTLESAAQNAAPQADNTRALPNLEKAALLYQGELLPDCYEDWAIPFRDRLKHSARQVLSQLVSILKENGHYAEAIGHCCALIRLDKLSEPSHYALIELHALNGDRAAALQAYKRCEAQLQKDLQIPPGAELQALHKSIVEGTLKRKSTYQKTEHTPQGSDTDQANPSPPESSLPPAKPKLGYALFASFAVLIALAGILLFRGSDPSTTPAEKSIAILPFENRSDIDADAYFTDGIHDDLITRISQVEDLKVISRTSVMGYRDSSKSLEKIARELGVATIVEGGVQRSGDEIRINVQLIDAQSGYHLWAENYTRKSTAANIFALQSEIADAVSRELQSVFTPPGQASPPQIPTENLAALEAYFYGRANAINTTSEGLAKAIAHYKRAIEIDPDFAEAHAAIALAYLNQIHFSGKPVQAQTGIAQGHIAKALELNNTLSNTYVSLGQLKYYETDYVAAERAYQTAIELDPNNTQAYIQYAISRHYQFGDYQTALKLSLKAGELAPRDPGPRLEQSSVLMSLGRVEEAKALLQQLIAEDPQNATAIGRLAWLYDESLNQYDAAIRLYRQAYALDPTNQNLSSRIAWAYFNLGDEEKFISWSERDIAVAPASHKVTFLKGFIHEFRGEIDESIANFSALKKSDQFYHWSAYKVTAAAVAAGRYPEAIEGFTVAYPWAANPDCAINASNLVQVIDYVYLLHLNGRHEQSRALGDRVIAFLPQATRISHTGYKFFDAHLYLSRGDSAGALAAIREFVELGGSTTLLGKETYTQSLHEEPEFKRLLDIVESRLAKQRQQIATWEAKGELAPIPDLEVSLGR
ncbi:BTAD domain-containing putative transcriptional regulator [Pelagicoccus enzymogenes]|uniref:tetratricopeptide repeat protein n=1 Tax=Pelagicoccus enzymogenes TaxID=2773457 RepID=UPI00280C7DAC|nr:tetratricopeptide repeat protein [Pelagicoccus enzymogenes]MDQ8197065.1 BTAD domain-containing putative transcriptional regulator [Pelagicoccus enzymogenes]